MLNLPNLNAHLKSVLVASLAASSAMTFAETEGERSLRLENERQLNEMNMRILIDNRNADDAVRAQMETQRSSSVPQPVSPQAADHQRYAADKNASERLLGVPVLSYVSFQTLQAGTPAVVRKAIDAHAPRLVKLPGLLTGDGEIDASAVYRQGNVMQVTYTSQLKSEQGYVGRRMYVTCTGKPPMVLLTSQVFARTKTGAARMARDPAYYGFSGGIQAAPLSGAALERVRTLCTQARTAEFEMSVPISEIGGSWSSVPVLSIQRAASTGRVSWVMLNHSVATSAHYINSPAWSAQGAPTQMYASIAGTFGGGTQWSAACSTGEFSSAALFVDNVNKVVKASPNENDGRPMKVMPSHTRLAFEFACAAAGAV